MAEYLGDSEVNGVQSYIFLFCLSAAAKRDKHNCHCEQGPKA